MAVGVTLVKKFPYRGNPLEEFSNQYWFTGAEPSNATAWNALIDALVAQEKTVLAWCTYTRAYGYTDPSPTANNVHQRDLSSPAVTGTLVVGATGIAMPGDDAVWIRWKTSRVTSPGGKPIYLRKYYHPAVGTTGGGDSLLAAQTTALNALGAKLRDGTFIDGRTLTDRNHTDVLTAHSVSPYITTRTLKRRGKRPNS